MSVLSEVLGNAAALHTITHKGRVYTVSLIDQIAQSKFEKWHFEGDKERLKALRDILPAEDYAARAKAIGDAWMAHGYNFFGPQSLAAVQTLAGMLRLASILMDCSEADVVRLVNECPDKVKEVVNLVIRESIGEPPAEKKAGDDPNAQAPG